MKSTQQPILPQFEDDSLWHRLRHFIPLALAYSVRHLTVGTVIRLRRRYLKWRGEKYYI